MPFKIEIAQGSKVCHFEAEVESLIGKKIGDSVDGAELGSQFSGYEFQITGASDRSGFPALEKVEGAIVKRVLLKKGTGMRNSYSGLRLKKSVHGNTVDSLIVQINLKVTKAGQKSIAAILGKEEKPKEEKPQEKEAAEPKAAEIAA